MQKRFIWTLCAKQTKEQRRTKKNVQLQKQCGEHNTVDYLQYTNSYIKNADGKAKES